MNTNKEYLDMILPALAAPMPYKWRVQSFSTHKPEATCVAYIDARDTMERLDSVCVYGWHRRHVEIKGHIYCEIGVVMPDGSVLWRADCGVESNTDAEKGESSDSFKRAGVNFGIGRFLYDLDIVRLPANEAKTKNPVNWPFVVDANGKKVWDLTKHINGLNGNKPTAPSPAASDIPNNKQPPKVMPSNLTIGDAEFNLLNYYLDTTGSDKMAFCKHFEIQSVAALPMAKFAQAVAMLKRKMAVEPDREKQYSPTDIQDQASPDNY